ncbi:MAG: ATP-binding protein, partial [Actinomycetota bacterium]|nr:ATP-binding protein [Actinomycetota bacterium]
VIAVSTMSAGRRRGLRVQDTGAGVDLDKADELFEPFVRRSDISSERRSLGLGGSGLGLTIVRVIATNRGCMVRFVEPVLPFRTALELSWSES